jgi:eukaryotic-like serine/threonine-protein kinase
MRAAVTSSAKLELGKEWQGQIADGRFPLEQYVGGSEETAVFLTHLPADPERKAVIKLAVASRPDAEELLANWKRAGQISHPHLLKVFDAGRCWLSGKELLYVVTEYADESLAQVVPQRALTPAEADAMLRPTLAALAYLHDQGLVHGQIEPGNVMAVGDQLKLSSLSVQPAGSMRRPSGNYAAPETTASPVSPAADVWSLGMMLVQSLTREMPRGKNDIADLPAPYAEIVRQCLAKDPASRWTIRDIAAAVRLQLPGQKVSKPRQDVAPPTIETVPVVNRGSRRTTGLIFFFTIVAFLAIALTVKLLRQGSAPATQRATAQLPPATTQGPKPSQAPPAGTGADQSGAVAHRVMPQSSNSALRTIHGRLKVRASLKVDENGDVANARLTSPGPSKYFSRISMEAAKQWKFTPPVVNGQASPSEWNVLFEFTRGGVQVIPQEVASR